MNVKLQAKNKDVHAPSPFDMFVTQLPAFLEAEEQRLGTISSSFAINVFGEGGGLFFVDPKNKVSREQNENDNADCIVEMGIEEFRSMTRGNLDADAAFESGKLRFNGDPEQLVALGALFS